jgi:hypothetical protein
MEYNDERIIVENSVYLDNLEKWIDAVILQDGLSDKQIATKVTGSFRRSMQANMDYHKAVADNSDFEGNKRRHRIMVEIYEELRGT